MVASLLNIKSTSRNWAKQRIPMCGFPLMHLDRHLKTLVQVHGRCVALCEEFPRPAIDGVPAGFERRVARIVTPGTLIDEPFLDQHENNYLLAVTVDEKPNADNPSPTAEPEPSLGLAWIDVSTGEFFAKTTTMSGLRDEIVRLSPKEVVLDKTLEDLPDHALRQILVEEGAFVSYTATSVEEAKTPLIEELGTNSDDLTEDSSKSVPSPDTLISTHSAPISSPFSASESTAIALLTSFLSSNLMDHMPLLGLPRRDADSARMSIDASTLTALEIKTRSSGSTEGSLLSAVRRTVTSGGARLLARWLCAPSTSLREIKARQRLVALFHVRPHLRADLRQLIRGIADAPRLLQKLAARRGAPPDLAGLHTALGTWTTARRRIELERTIEEKEKGELHENWEALNELMRRMATLEELGQKIEMALQRTNLIQAEGANQANTDADDPESPLDAPVGDTTEDTFTLGSPERWSINPE
jgi:DNA mismatch repair ATPase MutS